MREEAKQALVWEPFAQSDWNAYAGCETNQPKIVRIVDTADNNVGAFVDVIDDNENGVEIYLYDDEGQLLGRFREVK